MTKMRMLEDGENPTTTPLPLVPYGGMGKWIFFGIFLFGAAAVVLMVANGAVQIKWPF